VAEQMLALVDAIARERGACKLTLEVLQGNASAMRLYERVGFAGYQLDPAMGQAQFLQKWLD
jgi:ribosomal protein S18 acetylase RimI-like enzyme